MRKSRPTAHKRRVARPRTVVIPPPPPHGLRRLVGLLAPSRRGALRTTRPTTWTTGVPSVALRFSEGHRTSGVGRCKPSDARSPMPFQSVQSNPSSKASFNKKGTKMKTRTNIHSRALVASVALAATMPAIAETWTFNGSGTGDANYATANAWKNESNANVTFDESTTSPRTYVVPAGKTLVTPNTTGVSWRFTANEGDVFTLQGSSSAQASLLSRVSTLTVPLLVLGDNSKFKFDRHSPLPRTTRSCLAPCASTHQLNIPPPSCLRDTMIRILQMLRPLQVRDRSFTRRTRWEEIAVIFI